LFVLIETVQKYHPPDHDMIVIFHSVYLAQARMFCLPQNFVFLYNISVLLPVFKDLNVCRNNTLCSEKNTRSHFLSDLRE